MLSNITISQNCNKMLLSLPKLCWWSSTSKSFRNLTPSILVGWQWSENAKCYPPCLHKLWLPCHLQATKKLFINHNIQYFIKLIVASGNIHDQKCRLSYCPTLLCNVNNLKGSPPLCNYLSLDCIIGVSDLKARNYPADKRYFTNDY